MILHHSASKRDFTTFQDIENWHKSRFNFQSSLGFWSGYHFIIMNDGTTHKTRRENEMGAHCIPNDGKIGICLVGNFEEEMPTPKQLEQLGVLLEYLKREFRLTNKDIYSHNEKSQTLCPGYHLTVWLDKYKQVDILKEMIEKLKRLFKGLIK